jgi:hypothetical protein
MELVSYESGIAFLFREIPVSGHRILKPLREHAELNLNLHSSGRYFKAQLNQGALGQYSRCFTVFGPENSGGCLAWYVL